MATKGLKEWLFERRIRSQEEFFLCWVSSCVLHATIVALTVTEWPKSTIVAILYLRNRVSGHEENEMETWPQKSSAMNVKK